ncbi:hypothetical protein LCGC14_0194380 [marine sediment metagenome]|uniref:HNH nuclease domain-containing protein n=1 Tax=marine sediment metagenome TaxID=412755 RepID=A0A0F9X443_9ZZZZ
MKDILGYEGLYSIDKRGNVFSHRRRKVMSPRYRKGYVRATLTKNKIIRQISVQQLVAQAFIPNPENKPYVNHKNLIKDDNRVENLEWVTHLENVQHFLKNRKKRKNKGSKLTKHDVDEIRRKYPEPRNSKPWKRYNITDAHYYSIVANRHRFDPTYKPNIKPIWTTIKNPQT